MNRIIFTLLFLFPFVGHSFAQQQKYETLQVMNEERQEYQNEVRHFITHTYYAMLVEAIATTEVHNSFINYLMQEDAVKYMPEFVSDYADKRYMSPTQYFGCLHRAFSAYNSDELKFSINNMQVDNDFYSYGLRGCFIRAEYDLEIKCQDEILSRKRCRMYCLFPNRNSKNIIKVMQLEPVKDLMSENDTGSGAEESFDALLKKAKGGDSDAQYKLANKYFEGIDVYKDYETAVYWYRQAAEQGHTEAQYRLGYWYENGFNVSQDYQEALKWYQKAAAQGDEKAKSHLADLNSRLLKNNESKNVAESDATHEWVKVSFDTPLLFHEGTIVLQKPTEVNAQLRKFYTEILDKQQFTLLIVGHVTQDESVKGKFTLALQRAKNIEFMLKKHGNIQHCEVKAVDVSNPSQSAEVKIYMYVSKEAVKNAQNDQI